MWMATAARHDLVRRWETFWFRQVSPHSYALLRMLFGLIGFASVLGMTPVDQFWTPDGLFGVPADGLGFKAQVVSLGYGTFAGRAFFVILLVSFAALAVGYSTGAAIVACFVGSVFQPLWNWLPLSAAHHVVVVVLFCLLWVDCGRVWSIDAWRARRRGTPPAPAPDDPVWPLRLIRFQVALIYLNSGLWKFNGELWRDGSAVHYATALNVFHRFPSDVPAALDWLSTVGTYATLIWEIGFPLMVLHPWTRRFALIVGVLLHIGMGVTLELGPFSAIMIASYVAFLDPDVVARIRWRPFAFRIARPRESREAAIR
jgi:hypothetical protein